MVKNVYSAIGRLCVNCRVVLFNGNFFFFFIFVGTAYVHGIKHATGNFIIIMDADLSHHVSCFSWVM